MASQPSWRVFFLFVFVFWVVELRMIGSEESPPKCSLVLGFHYAIRILMASQPTPLTYTPPKKIRPY